MPKPDDKFVRVYVDGDTDPDEFAKTIGEMGGVLKTEVVPTSDEVDWLLREVGRRISEMENHEDLCCPLREIRHDIEEFLDEEIRPHHFDASKILRRG
jgi:hypothetical protein